MKAALENASSPMDTNLDVVLPGVHGRLDAVMNVSMQSQNQLQRLRQELQEERERSLQNQQMMMQVMQQAFIQMQQ